jgi:hypothetical protein
VSRREFTTSHHLYTLINLLTLTFIVMPLKRKFNLKNLGSWVIRKKKKSDSEGEANKENVNI